MRKKLWVLLFVSAVLFTMVTPVCAAEAKEEEAEVIRALNGVLVGVLYPSEEAEGETTGWSDGEIRDTVYRKLLWDDYGESDASYLSEAGISYWSDEKVYCHYDLELIQKLTQESFGREYPEDAGTEYCYISGTELLVMPAAGEYSELQVLDYAKDGEVLNAAGIAVNHYSSNSEFQGYFRAVFKENPSGIYGYTLEAVERIEEEELFEEMTEDVASRFREAADAWEVEENKL